MKLTVKDINVTGKRVLVRVDFNVPLKGKEVADDGRIRAALPTINYLRERQARIILVSHLGRPKGKVKEELRLNPVARRLSELLQVPVHKTDYIVGEEVKREVDFLGKGEILLLENVRFDPREEANDPQFARSLAELADVFVNDAFGAAHRAHASTSGLARFLPAVAGLLMAYELENLSASIFEPLRPLIAILGGAKVADKIGVIRQFLDLADLLLIGGGMANTFLAARGNDMGDSLIDRDHINEAAALLKLADEKGKEIKLPVDLVCAPELRSGVEVKTVPAGAVPAGWKALDIGPETVKEYARAVEGAGTILWNGPLGAFEVDPFDHGSKAVAVAVARSEAASYAGGGDTAALIEKVGARRQFTFISTGGGASLEFWEGRELPGVEVLKDAGCVL